MKGFRLFVLLFSFLVGCCFAESQPVIWYSSYQEALDEAQRSHRDLFISFSGTYFTPKSIVVKKEIYANEEFLEQVQKHYVLLAVEKPSSINLFEKPEAATMFRRFGVNIVPSVVLCQSDGAGYKRFRADEMRTVREMLDQIDPAKVVKRVINKPLKQKSDQEKKDRGSNSSIREKTMPLL